MFIKMANPEEKLSMSWLPLNLKLVFIFCFCLLPVTYTCNQLLTSIIIIAKKSMTLFISTKPADLRIDVNGCGVKSGVCGLML